MIRNSFRNKLIVFLLVATILPISTSIVVTYFVTERQMIEDTIQTNSNLIYQGQTNLTHYLNVIQQASLLVYKDNDLFTVIDGGTKYNSSSEIFRGLQSINNSVREIQQVFLYIKETKKSTLYNTGISYRNEGVEPIALQRLPKGEILLEPTHMSHSYQTSGFNPIPTSVVFTMHRSIVSEISRKELGMMSIDVKLDVIEAICRQLYTQGEEELYVLDTDGTVIFGPKDGSSGNRLEAGWARDLIKRSEAEAAGSYTWNSEGFKGLHIYERLPAPFNQWMIVKRIPNELLYSHARQLTLVNTMILLGFMIVVLLGTLIVSIRFTAPIKKLIGYIGKIQNGNLQVDIDVKGNDEFAILARRFRTMMQTINDLITNEYKLEIANKTIQLKALQAQIHPHFLYNALQSIGTLALQHDAPKVYSLLSSLAKMMRYGMNTHDSIVPFKKEVEHVRSYLDLQMQRFENELTIEIDIEEKAMLVPVPKMILQPLVENYFKHGFEPRNQIGRLSITGVILEEETQLRIEVCDNGKGMNKEQLGRLRNQLSQLKDDTGIKGESIGLFNVLLRLRLYYDQEAGISLDSEPGGGLRITLFIPVNGKEEHLYDRIDR